MGGGGFFFQAGAGDLDAAEALFAERAATETITDI